MNIDKIKIIDAQGAQIKVLKIDCDLKSMGEVLKSLEQKVRNSSSSINELEKCISLIDLTTLEGSDTQARVQSLCLKAKHPLDKSTTTVAAICVYPNLLPVARESLKDSSVKLASVAGGFPSSQIPLDLKLLEVKRAVELGALEIDMVMNRGAFLEENYQQVFDEIVEIKKTCQKDVLLKVILETGELENLSQVKLASWIAMHAGADFIKTSTGKISKGATLEVCYVMMEVILDFYKLTGQMVGIKVSGGVRTPEQALSYKNLVLKLLGKDWLSVRYMRLGASSLLDALVDEIQVIELSAAASSKGSSF